MGASCFGKLPIHPGFIQHKADGPEIESLYKWFQAGMGKLRQVWGARWKSEYQNAPPSRFLYRESATSNLVAGAWISSMDMENEPQPFVVCTKIPQSLVGDRPEILPLVLWDFLRKAEEMAIGGWSGATLDTFLSRIDTLSCSLDLSSGAVKYRTYLQRKSVNDLWSSIFGSFDDERKYLLLHNLAKYLEGDPCDIPARPLRFPLSPAVIATFWVDLSFRLMNEKTQPVLSSWNSNSLTLLFRELEGINFLPHVRPDLAKEHGFDLVRARRENLGFIQEAREKYTSKLEEQGLPLGILIERISKTTAPAPAANPVSAQPESPPVATPVSPPPPVQMPEPVLKPVSQPTPDPVLKPVSQPVPEPVLKPVSQPAPEPVLKPISHPPSTAVPQQPAQETPADEGNDIHIRPRSEGLLRHSRYPHGCYGKLPIFGDFIRDRNNLPEINSMDMWFQAGILAARQADRNWEAGFTSAPTSRFLFASPDSRNLIAGVWIASVDRAGRRYPFLIYTIAPTAELGSHPQLYPLFFSDFFHQAQEVAENGWKGGDLKSLGEKVERLTYHKDFDAGRAAYEKYLVENTSGDLARQLFNTADSPATMLLPFNLQTALLPIRTGSHRNMQIALRFPRRKGVEPTFWIDLTMRMSGRTSHPTLVTWTNDSLTILYPDLAPKFYSCLMQPALQGDSVAHLEKLGADNTGILQRARERFGAISAKHDLPLGQLLRGLTGR